MFFSQGVIDLKLNQYENNKNKKITKKKKGKENHINLRRV